MALTYKTKRPQAGRTNQLSRRMGAKKSPFYRVVVADSRFPRDGRFIEEIGTYDPMREPAEIKIDAEKAKAWIANGAQPTDTVRYLLKKSEIL